DAGWAGGTAEPGRAAPAAAHRGGEPRHQRHGHRRPAPQLRQTIGPARDLVLVNTFDPEPWQPEVNAALAAASRAGRTGLADWHHAIAGHAYLLWPDGIHPRPAGARHYAGLVRTAIRSVLRPCA